MPKSRYRKGRKATGIVRMTPQMRDALLRQRERFRAKFGRDPSPSDPALFDPDADTPVPISGERLDAEIDKALREAGIDPATAAAFKKLFR